MNSDWKNIRLFVGMSMVAVPRTVVTRANRKMSFSPSRMFSSGPTLVALWFSVLYW